MFWVLGEVLLFQVCLEPEKEKQLLFRFWVLLQVSGSCGVVVGVCGL